MGKVKPQHIFSLMALLALSSCEERYISVHTDYLSHQNLASYVIKTPDPLLCNPPVGQRLIIGWSVPKTYLQYENLHLVITIRFRNRTQIVEELPLEVRKGTFVYPVLNEDYFTTRGILTYKVDLIGGGSVLEEWRHQIWTELITVETTATETESAVEKAEGDESEQDVKSEQEKPIEGSPSNFYEDFE